MSCKMGAWSDALEAVQISADQWRELAQRYETALREIETETRIAKRLDGQQLIALYNTARKALDKED